jgi:hypothetical protein
MGPKVVVLCAYICDYSHHPALGNFVLSSRIDLLSLKCRHSFVFCLVFWKGKLILQCLFLPEVYRVRSAICHAVVLVTRIRVSVCLFVDPLGLMVWLVETPRYTLLLCQRLACL